MTRFTIFLPLLLCTAASTSAQIPFQGQPPARISATVAPDIHHALADWRRLRQSSNYTFGDYARFLIGNPGWPGESTLRSNAEKAMRPGEHAGTVLAFFQREKPTSGNGHARLADALLASGRSAEAIAAARNAWVSDDLSSYDETQIYTRFGTHLTAADHDRRADALLFDKKASDAHRMLGLVSAGRRPAFEARIALQSETPNAEAYFQRVAGQVGSDAGLLMDRLRYLRSKSTEQAARALAARPHNFQARPINVDRYFEMLLLLAEGAANDGQWTTAYNISRQLDDAFAPGTDLSDQPYGVRDKYTSLAWLAGRTALDRLRDPGNAMAMFDRYSRGGRSLQVLTKGLYWAGRAGTAAGRLAEANAYFQRAAGYPELFYGQLALERVGRSVPRPHPLPTFAVTNLQRAQFGTRRLTQATRLLGQQGQVSEQALFVRALAESVENDADRVLAIEFGQQIGRQDLPVWVARNSRNQGYAFYVQQAFPMLPANAATNRNWSLNHGITRQESSFDRSAVSHAGARGMMQLMPGTAREQAGKMGYGYDYARLTSDPHYNVMLGSAYFQRMLNMWDGNVPLAVASYNAGAGNVRKWVDRYGDPRRGTDVVSWIEAIPFSETKGYVQRVIENSVVYDAMRGGSQTQSAMHVSNYLGKNRPG